MKWHERQNPSYLHLFAEWLGMTDDGLRYMLDSARNPAYWVSTGSREWFFNGWSSRQATCADVGGREKHIDFISNSRLDDDRAEQYIIIGKGHP